VAHEDIPFAGDKVALVVRGKESPEHVPGKRAQHADCVRSQGAPVGYFGEDGEGNVYITTAVLIGVRGEVYDLGTFTRKRPYYVDASIARAYQLISTALVVRVTSAQASSFDDDWDQLTKDPGTFRLLGKNCSTRASGAFRHAGILQSGIPGLDTPDNLYRQLVAQRGDLCSSYSGYVGFTSAGGASFMHIEAP